MSDSPKSKALQTADQKVAAILGEAAQLFSAGDSMVGRVERLAYLPADSVSRAAWVSLTSREWNHLRKSMDAKPGDWEGYRLVKVKRW